MQNTRINYRYMNGTGEVLYETIVIDGKLQLADIKLFLKDDTDFIASQVDLPALNGRDVELDGPWHKISDVKLTDDQSDMNLTAIELIKNFRTAHQDGWNERLFFEEIAAEAADACNCFVVQVPAALRKTAEFEVIMQSSEFGQETFKHFSLDIAFEKILELYTQALSLGDGIERVIGLVVNPQSQHQTDVDVITIYRGHTSGQSCQAQRQDFIWACDQLGIGDPDSLDGLTTETYVFNDIDNFDVLKSFLKQKELFIRQTDTKGG